MHTEVPVGQTIAPLAVSRVDAAKAVGISLRSICDELDSGRLEAVRYNARVLVPVKSLEKWLASRPAFR